MSSSSKNLPSEPVSIFDIAIEILLVGLLAFAPFAFGSVEPWSELVVTALAGAMLVVFIAKLLLVPNQRIVWSAAYIPVVLFLVLAAAQLVPVASSLLRHLSPETVALRERLLGDLPDASTTLKKMPLTLYPHATRQILRLVITAATVFFVVANVFKTSGQIRRLLASIAFIGAGAAILALLQDFSGATRVYWIGPLGRGKATAGPFIAYTHFGQFLNLSAGAAMGLLFVELRRIFRRNGFDPDDILHRWREGKLRILWVLGGTFVVCMLAELMSGSRGALVAAAIAFAVATLVLSQMRGVPGRGWLTVPLALAMLACLPFLALDGVYNKFALLRNHEGYADRLQIVKDLTFVYRKFPLLGTGLGTHEDVYPAYNRSTSIERYTYAEDDYAQMMEEAGAVGVAIVGVFIVCIGRCFFKAVHWGDPPIRMAAVGLGFGLIAVMVQSFSDFGQHVPAIACLSATVCGLILSLSRFRKSATVTETEAVRSAFPVVRFGFRLACLAVVVVVTGWSALGIDRERRALAEGVAADNIAASLDAHHGIGTDEQFASLIRHASAAVAIDPDNVLSLYFLSGFRWRAMSRPSADSNDIVLTPEQVDFVRQINKDLLASRVVCPTFGPLYLLAAELESTVLVDQPDADQNAREAFALAQCDARACYLAASAEARDGHWDLARQEFARCVSLPSGSFGQVATACVTEFRRPEIALALAKGNRARLEELGRILDQAGDTAVASQVRSQSIELLKQEAARWDATPEAICAMAAYATAHQDYSTAADCYRRALGKDYGQVDLHIDLARVLAANGQNRDALHEARVCLRLDSQQPDALKMVADLSSIAGASDQ